MSEEVVRNFFSLQRSGGRHVGLWREGREDPADVMGPEEAASRDGGDLT